MPKKTNLELCRAAMNAQTNLHVFASVCALMEGSLLVGDSGQRGDATADRIVALCKKEIDRQLTLMDKAVAGVQKTDRREESNHG